MVLGSLSTITHGTTCVLPNPVFDAEQSLKAIEKEKCTIIYGTPTMYIDMYNHPNLNNYDVSSVDSGSYIFCQRL
jgi:fatty-acyl-CoA synthase